MTRPKTSDLNEAIRRCWAMLDPEHRRRWVLLVPLALAAAGLEAIGAGLIFAFVKLISTPDILAEEAWAMRVYTAFEWSSFDQFVIGFGAITTTFYFAKNALLLLEVYLANRVASSSSLSVATKLLRAYLHAPYGFHLRRSSSELVMNVNGSVDLAIRSVLVPASQLIVEVVLIIAIISVLLAAAPGPTLVVGLFMVALLSVLLVSTQARMRRWGVEAHELNAGILARLQQGFDVIKEIKVLGRERYFYESFQELRDALMRIVWQQATLQSAPRLVMETLFVAGVVALVAVTQGPDQGRELVPLLGLFAYAGFRVLPSIQRIAGHLASIQFGAASIGAVFEDWTELSPYLVQPGAAPTFSFAERLELSKIGFRYEEAHRPALSDLTLTIHHGESVGIVGTTGAGKSTLIDLIIGLQSPSEGSICADGVDIYSNLRGWQALFGYVPQAGYLIDDTLERNITLGLETDPARLERAVEAAQLGSFVNALPKGLATVVGERGVRFSGGERQRVSIARALYHAPQILVFDEATSALDPETEAAVSDALEHLRGQITMIVIAHRASAVARCDRVVRLEAGHMVGVEDGPRVSM